jgi:CHAT domain-containing protein
MQTLDRLSQLAEYPNKMIGEWEKRTGAKVNRVILAPHKFLHLVPLHAIQLPSGEIWGDTVAIQYVPSASVLCRLIQAMPSRIKADGQPVKQSVIAIAGQSDSHAFEREAKAVSRILGGVAISGGRKSVDEIVREIADADYIHFSCHGIYDRVSPMGGGLECAWGESRSSDQSTSANQPIRHGRLTLGEIFERVHLPRAPIVVLSACETGISKIEQSHYEYIGLPAGFLYAGAKTVVSSLWRVPDPAVQLLMKQMAQRLAEGKRISEALRVAQQWLRTLPWDAAMQEVATILQTDGSSTTSHDAESVLEMYPILRIADANPFENPFWWAGFTINGLG